MSAFAKFLEAGADCVAGNIIHKNVLLGSSNNGIEVLTPEGEAFLKELAEAKPKKAKKVEAAAQAEPTVASLSDLLGDE